MCNNCILQIKYERLHILLNALVSLLISFSDYQTTDTSSGVKDMQKYDMRRHRTWNTSVYINVFTVVTSLIC